MRFLAAALLLACPLVAHAQTAFPMLMSIKPVAATVGQSSEHAIVSRYTMYGAYEILVSGYGVTGEVLPSEIKAEDAAKKPVEQLKVKFHVAADALPGVRDVRVVMPTGVSTVGQLVIGTGPVTTEKGDNDSLDKATAVQVPATICGCVEKAEDVDFYKFHATAGQSLNFHVRCGRLQDKIHDLQLHCDPILMLRNAAGVTIASSDNYFRADPLLSQRFEQEGDYILEIRDVRYQGNQYWEYAIEISSQPLVECTFPLGVSRGTTELTAAGFLLSDKPLSVNIDANIPFGELWTTAKQGDQQTLPFAVEITDLPLIAEASADNNKPEQGQLLAIPCGLNGRLETEGDVDYYTLEAKKGEALSLEIIARRRNSAIDSHLRILNEKGVQLQLSDDLKVGKRNYSDSWIENWIVPADGKYTIEIRDVHLRGGGARFPYFLQITRSQPYFELYLDTDKTQIPLGSHGVIYCRVERKNGFTGPVDLTIEGLPPSITATCGRIQASKAVDGVIVLTAEDDAQLAVSSVRVSGTAVHEKEGAKLELSAMARPYQETYQPGGGRGHWPVDTHFVAVTDYGDIRRVNVSTQEIRLQPGGSQKIEVTIDRSPEFATNVTLDMLYRHLASSFGDSLPLGVSLDDKQAKTLLAGSDTKGFVTIKAAADAPPVENHISVVMAHVSLNFVMKTTYSSPPIRISVDAKK